MPLLSVRHRARLAAALIPIAAVTVAACARQTHGTGWLSAPDGAASVSPSSKPTPKQYFKDGKTYQAWIIRVKPGPMFVIDLAHHLVNTPSDPAATKYLESHGQSPGPDGIPNDYIDVDTHVHKTLKVDPHASVAINPNGTAPKSVTLDAFVKWLDSNGATPIKGGNNEYPGAPSYVGPIFAVSFKKDILVSISQIFEP